MELVRVPKVAEAITEGTVSRWHVRVGDRVGAGQPLVEMITEKAEEDVVSPASGRVAGVYAPQRSTVPVGYVLCALAEEGEVLPDVESLNSEALRRHRAELLGESADPRGAARGPDAGAHGSGARAGARDGAGPGAAASPAARRLARERGVSIDRVAAALGIDGRVSAKDVRRFLEGPR
jgi:pyruvate/2-oxoglutarate dehydrogenase complex dihydrolipoamide acyltransferase (E2) component